MFSKKILISFSTLSDAELQVKAQSVLDALTDNPFFTNPSPSLTDVKTALQDFVAATSKAKNRDKVDVIIKKQKKEELAALLKTLALYVQLEGQNNEEALASSGFTLKKEPQTIGVLPKPKTFTVTPMHPGTIKINISAVYGAKVYLYEYRIKGEKDWQSHTNTKTSVFLNNLTKATEYEFKVVAIGANTERVYSDIISSVVL